MSTVVNYNGTPYTIPATGDTNWGDTVAAFLIAVAGSSAVITSQIQTARASTSVTTNVLISDYAVYVNFAGAASVVLPSSSVGQLYAIQDSSGAAHTNNITITVPVGQTIDGASSYLLADDNAGVVVQFAGSNAWRIVAVKPQDLRRTASPTFANVTANITGNVTGTAANVTGTVAVAHGGTGGTSVATSPTASAFAGWDSNKNISANNWIEGFTSTATAASTTTLTVGSAYQQNFTGVTTQTVVLPVATTLVNGFSFSITNLSTGVVTVQTSGGNTVQAMAANTSLIVTCTNTAGGTSTASWQWVHVPGQSGALSVSFGGTGFSTYTKGDVVYSGAANSLSKLGIGATGNVLTVAGGVPTWAAPSNSGTVTSVAVAVPAFLSVSGSPITTNGIFTIGYSGTALPVANGGTGVTSASGAVSASTFSSYDSNGNLSAIGFIPQINLVTAGAGTTTLTGASSGIFYVTGSTTQTVVLPVAATLGYAQAFTIINKSTGVVTVESSGGNVLQVLAANTQVTCTCINAAGGAPTTTASWSWVYSTINSDITTLAALTTIGNTGANAQLNIIGELNVNRADANNQISQFSNTSSTNGVILELIAGDNTTSAQTAQVLFRNRNTNNQRWTVGTNGSDTFVIQDTKANANVWSVSPSGNLASTFGGLVTTTAGLTESLGNFTLGSGVSAAPVYIQSAAGVTGAAASGGTVVYNKPYLNWTGLLFIDCTSNGTSGLYLIPHDTTSPTSIANIFAGTTTVTNTTTTVTLTNGSGGLLSYRVMFLG